MDLRCGGNVFNEPSHSNDVHIHTHKSLYAPLFRFSAIRGLHRELGDLIELLLFFKIRKVN
jgi:hypothetical protein